jgi:hypothetical protein
LVLHLPETPIEPQDSAASPLDHCWQNLLDTQKCPKAVSLPVVLELLRRNLKDTAHLESTSVIDKNLGIAKLLNLRESRRH